MVTAPVGDTFTRAHSGMDEEGSRDDGPNPPVLTQDDSPIPRYCPSSRMLRCRARKLS